MKRLNSRKEDLYTTPERQEDDLNTHNINVVCEGSHVFKLAEAKVRMGDGRASIEEIISYLDWILDRNNSGYGSFKYACDLESLVAADEARDFITRLFESNNNSKIREYMGDDFDSFISDLNTRFKSIHKDPSDPLH